jgi:hypothetical protein
LASGRPGIVQVGSSNPGEERRCEICWQDIARQIEVELDPATVAERVLKAIRRDELYIFTHPGMRAQIEPRFAAILAAMDRV